MKIVLAFDSFKGCMTANEACHDAAMAIHEVLPDAEVVECPLSDGGEGLVDSCFMQSTAHCHKQESTDQRSLERVTIKVHDPLMNIIEANYVIDSTPLRMGQGRVAFMEMAAASGLTLVPLGKRNPMLTTTYGVGEMIIDAIRKHCTKIVIGIGGSATCDAGRGMIQCLKDNGYHDAVGNIVDADLARCKIVVASDVTNPLYGEQGAAYIFAPQKGATPEQVVLLDEQLRTFARHTEEAGLATPELAGYPGAGAAGGLGYGLMAYLKAELKSGIDIILDIKGFNALIQEATLIITGEGKSDEQTMMGKVPHGVLKRAREYDVPVWLLSGMIDDKDGTLAENFDFVKSINDGDNRPLEVLMQPSVAKENLKNTIETEIPRNILAVE